MLSETTMVALCYITTSVLFGLAGEREISIRWISHRLWQLLLLKLDKQIGGTIYQHILGANEACHMEGVGCPVGGGGVQ